MKPQHLPQKTTFHYGFEFSRMKNRNYTSFVVMILMILLIVMNTTAVANSLRETQADRVNSSDAQIVTENYDNQISPSSEENNLADSFLRGSAPTVNGLFYGDGDNTRYQLYATSVYGSELYTQYNAISRELSVALVVSHDVNDMVCSSNKNYTSSAGWNPPRPCNRLTDSEYAEFQL